MIESSAEAVTWDDQLLGGVAIFAQKVLGKTPTFLCGGCPVALAVTQFYDLRAVLSDLSPLIFQSIICRTAGLKS
jgi:hypothetical protein